MYHLQISPALWKYLPVLIVYFHNVAVAMEYSECSRYLLDIWGLNRYKLAKCMGSDYVKLQKSISAFICIFRKIHLLVVISDSNSPFLLNYEKKTGLLKTTRYKMAQRNSEKKESD